MFRRLLCGAALVVALGLPASAGGHYVSVKGTKEIIREEAKAAGVKHYSGWLISTVDCESDFQHHQVYLNHYGLGQFLLSTWDRMKVWLPPKYKGYIWSVKAQSRVMAEAFKRGRSVEWTCA